MERHGSNLQNVSEEECESFRAAFADDEGATAQTESSPKAGAATSAASNKPSNSAPSAKAVVKAIEPSVGKSSDDVGAKRRVFVVHGRDEAMRDKVVNLLYKAKCTPIVLSEQVNAGQTIVEKIEKYGEVEFAVVLLSPDDEGALAGEQLQPRARQNVLLELGYFFGRLKRNKLAILMKGHVEFPSDFAGVVWYLLDDGGAWKTSLAKEIDAAGISIDWKDLHS